MMNQEDIFRKVGQILNELQEQYEFLARNPNQLNELELELFLANANFLSDHVQIVKKINSHQSPVVMVTPVTVPEPIPEPEPLKLADQPKETEMSKEKTLEELESEYAANELAFTEKETGIVAEEIQAEEVEELQPEPLKFEFLLNDNVANDKFEFEEQPIEHIFDRTLSKEEEDIIAEKQKLRDSQQHPDESVEISVKPTLNDILAGKSNFPQSVNEDNNKTSITDLKQAINLNEKLLYIKDLFNGYNLAYAEAIELVNKMPDFKTADSFLQNNYAVKNNWAAKQSTVDKFYELLNQRFPVK